MNNKLAKSFASALAFLAMVAGVLVPSAAHATTDWVSAPTWSTLHSKVEDGVFERFMRQFDTNSRLEADSDTQHNVTYVRTDRDSVTVQYRGGLANAGKSVQFVMSGEVDFTDSISDPDNVVVTDSTGLAEVTITLSQTPQAEDVVRVSLSAGDPSAPSTVGPMVLMWQDPGYFPILKLTSSRQGFESRCELRRYEAGQLIRAHECTNGDFQEYTWAWSVFKKPWLPDYSQVYVKSYKYGATINVTYRVTDIWGTPLAGKDVYLNVDQGCRLCRWASFDPNQSTDSSGMVSFSVRNTNKLQEVRANTFVNSDTHAREGGFIALSIQPTTNELDESADYLWPQIVTDIDMKAGASSLSVLSRGGYSVNLQGNDVRVVDGVTVTNPPLSLDTRDSSLTDIDVVNLNITYMKNSRPIALYSPDIRVTADNGGVAAIFDNQSGRGLDSLASSASFRQPLVFSYTYPQRIALMCTHVGLTTFRVYTGTAYKTHTMNCVNSSTDAQAISSLPAGIAIPGTPMTQSFKVVDRWNNPVSGVTVSFASSGNGQLDSTDPQTTNSNGIVNVSVSASTAGLQTITATVVDPDNLTQVSSGTSQVSAAIDWGAPVITMTASGRTITVTFYNLQGQSVVLLNGTSRSVVSVSTPIKVLNLRVPAGRRTVRATAGALVKSAVFTIK